VRQFFEPFEAPQWLKQVLSSIRAALSDEWPAPLRTKSYAVADLPPAADWTGGRAFVTDANATTFASIVAAGGANGVPVYSDGTDWRIG
jgi:hypothetical protein